MKSILRFSFVSLFALSAVVVSRANWFNHPICTQAKVITGWFTPYSDVAGPHYLPGPTLPTINLNKIIDNWGTSSSTHGGSYRIYDNKNETGFARGYVNFPVTKGGTIAHPTYTVGAPTFSTSAQFTVYQ